jgi:hypothetical protein
MRPAPLGRDEAIKIISIALSDQVMEDALEGAIAGQEVIIAGLDDDALLAGALAVEIDLLRVEGDQMLLQGHAHLDGPEMTNGIEYLREAYVKDAIAGRLKVSGARKGDIGPTMERRSVTHGYLIAR